MFNLNRIQGQTASENIADSQQWDEMAKMTNQQERASETPSDSDENIDNAHTNPDPINQKQQLTELRDKLTDLASASKIESNSPETVLFSGKEIPVSQLGAERVLIDKIRPRSKFDFIGKRRDAKTYEELLETEDLSEAELSQKFTPEVASLFVDDLLDPEISLALSSPTFLRMIEALPVDMQAEFFSSKKATEDLSSIANYIDQYQNNKSIITKALAGATVQLNHGNLNKREITSLLRGFSRGLDKIEADGSQRTELYQDFLNAWDKSADAQHDDQEKWSKKQERRMTFATKILDPDSFYQHASEIIDPNYTQSDSFDLRQMMDIQQAFGPSKDKGVELTAKQLQQYQTLFPQGLRELADTLDGWYLTNQVNNMHEESATGVMDLLNSFQDAIGDITFDDKQELAYLVLSEHSGATSVIKQAQNQENPIDNNLAKNIRRYLKACVYDSLSDDKGESVESIEELRDYDGFLLRKAHEKIDSEDFDSARRYICEYAFGGPLGEIGRDLVATGIIEISSTVARSEIYDPQEFFNQNLNEDQISISYDRLAELSQSQALTDQEADLVVDANGLFVCNGEELAGRLSQYEVNHPPDTVKLANALNKIRVESIKRASRNYSDYMQQKIDEGARPFGEIDYHGEQIPLLKMEGDEFMLLVHRLGAYFDKDRDNPANWNSRVPSKINANGHPIGYISTSAIAEHALHLAAIENKDLSDPQEVFYAFTDFGEDTLQYMAEHDLSVYDSVDRQGELKTISRRQDFLYDDPRALINRTKEKLSSNEYGHNEVALDRYSGDSNEHYGCLQPDYLIAFTDDTQAIGDRVKKHAAYFHVPILMIDSEKYT